MDPNYQDWPSQEAPEGFAERTAQAILAADAAHSGLAHAAPAPLAQLRRRWGKPLGVFLLAAFFVGGAWAAYEYSQGAASSLSIDDAAEPAVVARPVAVHVGKPQMAVPESPAPEPTPKPRPTAPPAAEPTAPQQLIPPPPPSCDCGPGAIVCSCRNGSVTRKENP